MADLILLLQVDNELVLSLDNGFIFSHLLLSLFHLVLIVDLHVSSEVGQSVDFFVKTCDLAVLLNNELVERVDLILLVTCLALVPLEHAKKTVHAIIACLTQILNNPFTHLNLLLVLLKLCRYFLSIANKISQVLLLGNVPVLYFLDVLATHIDSLLLENAFMGRFCDQLLLTTGGILSVLIQNSHNKFKYNAQMMFVKTLTTA